MKKYKHKKETDPFGNNGIDVKALQSDIEHVVEKGGKLYHTKKMKRSLIMVLKWEKHSLLRGACILIIIFCAVYSYTQLKNNLDYNYNDKDILVEVSADNSLYNDIETFLNYLLYKVDASQFELKWVSGIPPKFKQNARRKIEKLAKNGFYIDRIAKDKFRILSVAVRANTEDRKIVYLDIAKVKIRDRYVYRLMRVY